MGANLYTEHQTEVIRKMQAATQPAALDVASLVRSATAELREFEAKHPGVAGRELRRARREIALKYYRMGKSLRKTLSRGHPETASRIAAAGTPEKGPREHTQGGHPETASQKETDR